MLVTKKFKLLISSKLANGDLVSMEFATELAEEGADEAELFEKAKTSVMTDLKKTAKSDPLAKVVWRSIIEGVKQEEKLNGDHG